MTDTDHRQPFVLAQILAQIQVDLLARIHGKVIDYEISRLEISRRIGAVELTLREMAEPPRSPDRNTGTQSASLTPGAGRLLNNNDRRALATLDDTSEPGKRVSWSEWAKSIPNVNTFRSVKTRLLGAGLAQAIPTGHKASNGGTEHTYAITPRGIQALQTGWAETRMV